MSFWNIFKRQAVAPSRSGVASRAARTWSAPDFRGPDQTSPESFIASFCADYEMWNSAAMADQERAETDDEQITAMSAASAQYKRLLRPFVVEGFQAQSIAYGSDSSFSPDRLGFTSVTRTDDTIEAAFFIKGVKEYLSDNNYIADIIANQSGEMRLATLDYVDPYPEDGRERLPIL